MEILILRAQVIKRKKLMQNAIKIILEEIREYMGGLTSLFLKMRGLILKALLCNVISSQLRQLKDLERLKNKDKEF
jgi:hypothetical protein